MRPLLGFPAVAALLITFASTASAATTHVPPGDGTLQAAIDAAAPGDTLVGSGRYTGPVVIDKRLHIVAKPGIQIDAGCAAPVGLTISADKLNTKGAIAVFGATATGIIVDGTTRSKFAVLTAVNNCGTATTGLIVRNTTRTIFHGGNVFDFTDTAIRLENLPVKAKIKFWGFQGSGSVTGLAIANIAEGAGRKGAELSIRVLVDGDTNGVVLTNADGIVVEKSNATEGLTGTSVTIDGSSTNNLFRSNAVYTVDDAGLGTCWQGNQGYADSCP